MQSPPRCVFCGTDRGPFDPEDVFPKWVRKVIPVTAPVKMGQGDELLDRRSTNVLKLKLERSVRRRCNNEWMSAAEKRVKKILAPAIRCEDNIGLNRTQQAVVTLWAIQKALLIELAVRQLGIRKDAYVSLDNLSWLYQEQTPPPGSRVWLGAVEAEGVLVTWHQSMSVVDKTEDAQCPIGHLSTFTIGYLLIQVFGSDLIQAADKSSTEPVEPPRLIVPARLRPFLLGIWPTVNPRVTWSPDGIVIRDDLECIAGWDGAWGI